MDKAKKPELSAQNRQVDHAKLVQELIQLKEDREQLKYELMRKTETFEANEKCLADDIEYWRSEYENIKKQLRSQKNHFEEGKIRTQNAHAEEIYTLTQESHKWELESAKLMKQLKDIQDKTIAENNDSERVLELEVEVSSLKEKLEEVFTDLNRSEKKASDLEDRQFNLIQENEEYKLSLNSARDEVRKSNELILELQDEVAVLKRTLDDLQYQPRDVNTKGNSLFAEVYDSRNQIKEKFLTVSERYQRLLKEKESLSTEVDILRKETATLRDIFNNDMKNFKPGNMFEASGDSASMSAMKALVQSYKDELEKVKREEPPAEREFQYYEAVIERQKRELEQLRGTLGDHTLSHAMRARKISELGVNLAYWKSKASEVESEKRYLQLKIQGLENRIKDSQSQNKIGNSLCGTEDNKNIVTHKSQCQKSKPKSPEKPKEKSLGEIYGSHKITFISQEEMKALMENKPYQPKESKSENKENENLQKEEVKEDNKNGLDNEDLKEEASNAKESTSNENGEVKKPKKTIQFSESTKKEDGEGHKPRGRNRYVFNFQVKKLE